MKKIENKNQNFNELAKFVNENEGVILTENNEPKYLIISYTDLVLTEEEKVEIIAKRLLKKHKKAFEELGQWLSMIKKRFYYFKNW